MNFPYRSKHLKFPTIVLQEFFLLELSWNRINDARRFFTNNIFVIVAFDPTGKALILAQHIFIPAINQGFFKIKFRKGPQKGFTSCKSSFKNIITT